MINKRKIAAAISTFALAFNSVVPLAWATTNLTDTGNGADSTNILTQNVNTTTSVVQSNTANITNDISVNTESGDNTASKNTGGNTTISTGDSVAVVNLLTAANVNKALVTGCETCNSGDTNLATSGNGADSQNTTTLNSVNTNSVFQNNDATLTNNVNAHLESGDNTASKNTGGTAGGNVTIMTGDSLGQVNITNRANANLAQIGTTGGTAGGTINLADTGNGADSNNIVTLNHNLTNMIVQGNAAWLHNNVDIYAESGDNTASKNTGNNTTIDTGMSSVTTNVDNAVNFNSAAVDCGCLTNLNAKIGENGSDSHSTVTSNLTGGLELFQGGGEESGNALHLTNNLSPFAQSGSNGAGKNTGPVVDPVYVATGNSGSLTNVTNRANENLFGTTSLPGGFDLAFNFDFGSLFGF